MTTRAWTFPVAHSTDAHFRAWVADFAAKLGEVGLVQTADTGQITIATATRPNAAAAAGYQIWKFSDNSVFLKFEYGSASSTVDRPGLWCTVGTGSDGAGTLTGTVSARKQSTLNIGLSSPGTARLSYMSHSVTSGFFGYVLYVDANGADQAHATLFVARSVDSNGALSTQGATVYWRDYNNIGTPNWPDAQALNFLTNTTQPVAVRNGTYAFVPHNITNTVVGSDQQAFVHWTAFPRASPIMQLATVSAVEFPSGSTFSASLVGPTPKNYISLDIGMRGTAAAAENFRIAMLWE